MGIFFIEGEGTHTMLLGCSTAGRRSVVRRVEVGLTCMFLAMLEVTETEGVLVNAWRSGTSEWLDAGREGRWFYKWFGNGAGDCYVELVLKS